MVTADAQTAPGVQLTTPMVALILRHEGLAISDNTAPLTFTLVTKE